MARSFRTAATAVITGALLLVGGQTAGVAQAAPSSGFNDWSCQPSAEHPEPVVLLHGLGGNGEGHMSYLGPYLAGAGYCAYTFTYGEHPQFSFIGGVQSVTESSQEIAAFIDEVRAASGALKVSLVGHSEGGFMSLYVPKVLGYAEHVRRVVALAPPTHGTTFGGLVTIGDLLAGREAWAEMSKAIGCVACTELVVDGPGIEQLTDGPIAQERVDYTIIATKYDLLVTPTETSFVDEPGVDNSYVQDTCPADPVGHIGMAFDSGIAEMITNALDPANAKPVTCGFGPPF
ncbi:MAG: alpha/beta fold hydrolase [Actinophytocola sp.]|nr:alpha/beta fold hydrolase [Actinophytocola sp.]